MIEGVLFDLFETLITESATRPPGASSLGPRLGLDRAAFRDHWKRRRAAVTTGDASFVQAIADIGMALDSPIDAADLEVLRRERVAAKAAALESVEASVLRVLDDLRTRGTRIGVVSNCLPEDVAMWETSRLAARVHCAVFSFDVGLAKPDPAIYHEAARRLGLAPEAIVFIGDGADDELVGARQAGIRAFRAVWFLSRWDHYEGDGGSALHSIEDVTALVA